jgi:2-keto-4-pentenoate hydratase/2-oxohepta-3-ene-1,7-dioic acid hydratase in catechol pathway
VIARCNSASPAGSYGFYQFDLHPGEVIATGTPSGVALGSKNSLRPGDSVEAGDRGRWHVA